MVVAAAEVVVGLGLIGLAALPAGELPEIAAADLTPGLLRAGIGLKLSQIKLATRSYLRDRTNQATRQQPDQREERRDVPDQHDQCARNDRNGSGKSFHDVPL